jgi:hypothetical protein
MAIRPFASRLIVLMPRNTVVPNYYVWLFVRWIPLSPTIKQKIPLFATKKHYRQTSAPAQDNLCIFFKNLREHAATRSESAAIMLVIGKGKSRDNSPISGLFKVISQVTG